MAATQEVDDEDIDPVKMIFSGGEQEEEEEGGKSLALANMVGDDAAKEKQRLEQQQQHYIRSIESTLVIRQLPSEGLSFQLCPAATTLVNLLDNLRCHPSSNDSPLTATLTALLSSSSSSSSSSHRKLRVLELGSGTGLVGIAAAATLGANVTVTDLPNVTANLQFNVESNAEVVARGGGAVNVAPLRWGQDGDVEAVGREFDLVLASDVVYHDHLFDPLIQTLRLLLNGEGKTTNTILVMAHLRRWKKESAFFKKAKKLFRVEAIHSDPPTQGSRIGVVVYRFVGKGKKLAS